MAASIPAVAMASALLLGALPSAQAQPAACSEAGTTIEISQCVQAELARKDQALKQAMQAVAIEAAAVPSDAFLPLWRENLTGFFKASANPEQQFQAFRTARLKACAYMNSLAFEGTGYGIFVTNCEIKLTDVLLEKLGN